MKELQLPIVVVHLVPLLSKYGMRETIVEAHAEHLLAWKSTFTCHGLHNVEDTEEDSKVADTGPKEQMAEQLPGPHYFSTSLSPPLH